MRPEKYGFAFLLLVACSPSPSEKSASIADEVCKDLPETHCMKAVEEEKLRRELARKLQEDGTLDRLRGQ